MTKIKIDQNIASNSFTGYFSGLWNFLCVKRQYKILGLYAILAIGVLFLIDVFGNFLNDYFGEKFHIVDNDFNMPVNVSDGWYNSTEEFHEGHYHKKIFYRPNSLSTGFVALIVILTFIGMPCLILCLMCKNCWESEYVRNEWLKCVVSVFMFGVFVICLKLLGKFALEFNLVDKTEMLDHNIVAPLNVSDGWFIEKNFGDHYKHYHKVVKRTEIQSGLLIFLIGFFGVTTGFAIILVVRVCFYFVQVYWIKPIQEYNETYYSLRNLDNIDATV